MRIYPAIDLLGGKCVRLKQGDFDRVSVFSGDPAAQAKKWRSEGASFIHVVDLDGARSGSAANNKAISEILAAVDASIQTGGGVRAVEDVKAKLDMGVSRVILGTAAIRSPEVVREAVQRFGPERVAAGVDAKGGFASASGWMEDSSKSALELCLELKELGITTVIYTDISKDGMMKGPSLEETSELIERTGLEVIASGGFSSMEDLARAEEIGASGAIVGQALYIGAISLREAIDAYEKDHSLPRRQRRQGCEGR